MAKVGRPSNDLTNKKFGKWTVIKKVENHRHSLHGNWWLCQCECGNEGVVPANGLRHGKSNSCKSCASKAKPRPHCHKDITGKTFNKIKVIKKVDNPENSNKNDIYYLCKCECGKEIIKTDYSIRKLRSCGCHKMKVYDSKNSDIVKKSLLSTYIDGAKKRGISFELTDSEFFEITKKNCFYCGKPPSATKRIGKNGYVYTGVDRKDSSKGYTKENAVPCCKRCNFGKREVHIIEFMEWVKRTHDFYVSSGKNQCI